MKILFVIHSLKFGGAERQLVELVKGLKENLYGIHVVCLDHDNDGYRSNLENAGIIINNFFRTNKYDLRPVLKIMRYVKKENIQVIHTFDNLGSLFGLIASKLSGRSVLCSVIRDCKDKNLKLKISKKIIAKLSDVCVSNSHAGFNNRFKKIKPNFKVVYNGIDFKRFNFPEDNIFKIKNSIGISNTFYAWIQSSC